jgi:reactive intermediate/imine deaminase
MPDARYLVTQDAPKPAGPYSHTATWNGLVFVAAQGPTDPATGEVVSGEIEAQVRRTFENIGILLQDAGSSLNHLLRITLYLVDLDDFAAANKVFEDVLPQGRYPARSTIPLARARGGMRVMLDAIGYVPD